MAADNPQFSYRVPDGGLFFLDTNIFVYALLASEPLKKQRALIGVGG